MSGSFLSESLHCETCHAQTVHIDFSHLSMFCGVAGASRLDREASDKAENYANGTASPGVAATPGKAAPPSTPAAKTNGEASPPKALV